MADSALDTQIACVLREISLRNKVYPRWVQLNKMTQAHAEHELKTMEAVYRTLLAVQEQEAAQMAMVLEHNRR